MDIHSAGNKAVADGASHPGASPPSWRRWLPYADAALSALLMAIAQAWAFPLIVDKPDGNVIFDAPWQGLVAFIALVPLIRATTGKSPGPSFRLGFTAGFIYFSLCLYWVNIAMMIYGMLPWYVSLLAHSLLMAILATYWGLTLAATAWLHNHTGISPLITLPFAWAAAEWLRNHLFTGFSWSNIAYTQTHNLVVLQSAAVWGTYGIAFLIVAVNVLVAALWTPPSPRDDLGRYKPIVGAREALPILRPLALIPLALVGIYGAWRLWANDRLTPVADPVRVGLVQGNIPQETKNRREVAAPLVLRKYRRLTEQAVKEGAQLVIWPEAATNRLVPQDAEWFDDALFWINPRVGADLFIGAPAVVFTPDGDYTLSNSGFLLDDSLRVKFRFDKSHLVPFGEYMPWWAEKYLHLRKIVPVAGAFVPGSGSEVVPYGANNATPFGCLICYEGVFPEISRRYSGVGMTFLVNLTNDAWYGYSSAPWQHLAMYVFRSVENRRYTLRAANTGISAVIDPSGRVVSSLPLMTEGVLHAEVIPYADRTPYSYLGDFMGWGSLGLLLALWGWRRGSTAASATRPGVAPEMEGPSPSS